MKQALLLFAKISVDKGLADPQSLTDLLNGAKGGVDVKWAFFDDLVFNISNELTEVYDARNQQNLQDYAVVYFRYWGQQQGHAMATARICQKLGVRFIDREVLRDGSFSKLTQYVNLAEAGIPFPDTLVANAHNLLAHYESKGFTFPLILKALGGTRGLDNYLVQNEAQLRQLLDQNAGLDFLLQTYIENDGDYRVVVMGDDIVMLIRRKAKEGTHLNNTSQGGSAEIVPIQELPEEVQDQCVQAAKFFKRDVAGIDMVKSKTNGRYYCFEVNRAPQIEQASFKAEKAELLVEYLAQL